MAQPGDLATSDVGASFSGYVSDVARTAVIGKASDHQRSIYDRLVEVHRRTIDAMAPGVPASEVFQAAVREYDRVKIPFPMAFAGHGIGLHVHEKPLLSAHEHTPLQPGMVFAVETRVRWPEKESENSCLDKYQTRALCLKPRLYRVFIDTSKGRAYPTKTKDPGGNVGVFRQQTSESTTYEQGPPHRLYMPLSGGCLL